MVVGTLKVSLDRLKKTTLNRGVLVECSSEQNRELFSDIRGRGGASNACFHS